MALQTSLWFRYAALVMALLSGFSTAFAAARDKSVTLCLSLEPPHLDPSAGAGQVIREITVQNIFEGLVALGQDGKISPRLAESWDVSPDGKVYTFHLRKGVTFHDGTPLTAGDVKFSFERARQPASAITEKWIFAPIESVTAPDTATVTIRLTQQSASFLEGLSWGEAVVFSEKSAAQNTTNPIGTGPYAFVNWRRGDRLTLKHYDRWWGGTLPIVQATYRFIPDAQAQVAAVLAGDCDALSNAGAPEHVAALRAHTQLTVQVGTTEGETILAMNNARAPFSDVRVRRALTAAIDRNAIIQGAMAGLAKPIGSHFSPAQPAYVDLTDFAPYDPARARALLEEAGYAQGFAATLAVPPVSYARQAAEIIAAQLQAVGVRITLVPLEFPQWLERVYKNKDYDLSIIAHTEPLDIRIYARDDYYFNYRSPVFQDIMKKIETASTAAERDALYAQAQRQLAQDAVNAYLFMLPKISVARKGLRGLWQNWSQPFTPLQDLAWE